MILRILLCAVCLSGCKPRAPKLEPECTFDQDCTLTALGPNCCETCEPRIGNTASTAAFTSWCAAHPATGCAELKCPGSAVTPMCEKSRCISKSGIHP